MLYSHFATWYSTHVGAMLQIFQATVIHFQRFVSYIPALCGQRMFGTPERITASVRPPSQFN
jgi:hypothetical protein